MFDIQLYKSSDRTIEFTLRDIPAGDSVAKAYFMVKKNHADADGAAVLSKSTATAGQGSIVDAGGTSPHVAVIRFEIANTDLAALESTRVYFGSTKVILTSGKAVSPSEARGNVRILAAGVQAAT